MKRIALFIFFFVSICGGFAQSISVKSFQALPMDLTAMSLEGKRIDQNGDVAALIKVVTTETGFVFEGGTLGIVDTKQTPGEVWVWVPRASRKITIKHQLLGVLRDYRYPVEIESERTYEMVLVTGTVETIVKEEVRKQFLAFQITPPNATLEVNDQIWDLSPDGTTQKFVDFGTYTYRAQAPNYHPDAGKVVVDDPDNTKKVPITLNPNYGWIEVAGNGSLQGANVYIDNVLLGKAPCKSDILKSGNHSLRITKDMYQPYNSIVEVKDNETTSVAPALVADFAEVTLQVDADAEIWVNNELKGVRIWTGPLSNGTYKIECKQANHEPSVTTKSISSDMAGQPVVLPAPRPIFGSLTVESTPTFAKVFVDGKEVGETPKFIKEIIIGQHELRVTKAEFSDYMETVTIGKGENKQVKVVMDNATEVSFSSNVPDAELYVDEKLVGNANGSYKLSKGEHVIKAKSKDYRDEPERVIEVSDYCSPQSLTFHDRKPNVGGLGLKAVDKMARDSKRIWCRVNPDLLVEGEDGSVCFDVIITIPAEYFDKKAVMNLAPYILYNGGQINIDPIVIVGEKVQETGVFRVNYKVGGEFTKHYCMPYQEEMANCELRVDLFFYEYKNAVYFTQDEIVKNVSFSQGMNEKLADGVIQSRSDVVVPEPSFVSTLEFDGDGNQVGQINSLLFENIVTAYGTISFNMIEVNGGSFQMGYNENEDERIGGVDISIQLYPILHSVTLDDFYIGETEVTQSLWQAVMGNNPSYYQGEDLPVENVSWEDCQKFIKKLNKITGKEFRLPTEAEWEFAARGGTKSNGFKYAGSNNIDDVAWHNDNSDYITHPVGQLIHNELGIYDMTGNVGEWCSDWYGDYSSSSQTNPQGPSIGSYRVVRGGSWLKRFDVSSYYYVSTRSCGTPDSVDYSLGFRLALSK